MKTRIAVLVLLFCGLMAAQTPKQGAKGSAPAKAAPAKHAFTPNDVQYGPAPPSLSSGAQLAVLEGNPMGSTGDYTVRVKMPDGYKIAPHWHPKRENVTVLSGTLKVGMGDKWDDSRMADYPAGSFAYVDPSMHHYAGAKGETVIQIHGASPLQINYVNPGDDPSKAKGY